MFRVAARCIDRTAMKDFHDDIDPSEDPGTGQGNNTGSRGLGDLTLGASVMSRGMIVALVVVVAVVAVLVTVGGAGLVMERSGDVAPHALNQRP